MRAVVTGAASGLGHAIVVALVAKGAQVVGVDLAGERRSAAVQGAGATFVACDVTVQGDWDAAAETIRRTLGIVDMIALNAGVMTRSPVDAIDDDPLSLAGSVGYRRVFAVNVDGVVFGLAALRPLLTNDAAVVMTASTAGLSGLNFDPYYSASKHAVVGLVRSLAPSLALAGIRLNALCPGGIDTAIVPDHLRAVVPVTAFRPPAVVAQAVLAIAAQPDVGATWLLSDDDNLIRRYDVPPLDGR